MIQHKLLLLSKKKIKIEYYGQTQLCYLGLGKVVLLLAWNSLGSGIVSSGVGSLNTLQAVLRGGLATAVFSCPLCQTPTRARALSASPDSSFVLFDERLLL